ncbi:baseplate J/gp47 family protein [Sulfitobacter faviae]|uniref:Baseplate J/gp47 family protein n=1 Tax=Sulfitobacter faviae TaxID=1775881 RepID=A0ABZ0V2K1_9RHOB|nr:baseplate J/gp47 family protein [Sulfitobacter faviae]WPZ23106.1 baseplate J/gp47 family protein [Sulfitobacter faviae]
MSRFAALDLTTLPDPTAIGVLDFDAILEARLAELEAQLSEVFDAPKVAEVMALARNIAASPIRYLNEAGAARELYMENRINEAVRSVFLSTARGNDLDQIGANRGVLRKVLDDSDPDNPVMETDEALRARIQLVIEAWSPHGTEGSYVYWALDADDRVVDVAVYGPNHGLEPPIPPAEPKMVILSSEGDGTADAALLEAVFLHCTTDKRRPVADKLSVISASPAPYAIEAVLHVTTPETASAVQEAAQAAATAFVNSRIRIGRKLYRTSLAAALTVQGVVDVELISPAADLDIGPFEAPHCTGVNLTLKSITGGWRDV